MGRDRGEAGMRRMLDTLLPNQALAGAVVTACPPHLKQQRQRRAEQSPLRPSSPIRRSPPPWRQGHGGGTALVSSWQDSIGLLTCRVGGQGVGKMYVPDTCTHAHTHAYTHTHTHHLPILGPCYKVVFINQLHTVY